MAIEKGSMREVIDAVYQILINDEEVLRLLWYKPKRISGKDPLDPSLPNILELDEEAYWDIVDERIMLQPKVSDIVDNPICRLYITSGRRRSLSNNYYIAKQQIIINTYVHEEYLGDMRSESIADRLAQLLALENLSGAIGKLNHVKSDPYEAPTQYQRFQHVYEYTDMKKQGL